MNIKNIPLPNYSSFFFKTYEYNDRKLIERNITKKNRWIVIGGGIGFIPCITYKISGNKLIIFEINSDLISNLNKNLISNRCKYKLYNENLVIFKNEKLKKFYLTNDFLATSSRIITNKFIADTDTPVSALLKISNNQKYSFLLESEEGGKQRGQYSLLGCEPDLLWKIDNGKVKIETDSLYLNENIDLNLNPIESLKQILHQSFYQDFLKLYSHPFLTVIE